MFNISCALVESMSLLSEKSLKDLLNNEPPLVEGLIDSELQVQPNGIEMTLKDVYVLEEAGKVDYDNSSRSIPNTTKLEFDDGWIYLQKGYYKITFNEIVNIPKNMAAIARARSSLIRCGVTLETAVWDAGYRGRSECLLLVHNKEGFHVEKNARVMQLLFYVLDSAVEHGYAGMYQNENI